MCKHVAATLYGVGARLDARPDLLFVLRGVDHNDLVHAAATRMTTKASDAGRVAADIDLGALFGIELDAEASAPAPKTSRRVRATAGTAAQKAAVAGMGTRARTKPAKRRRRRGQRLQSPIDKLVGFIEALGQAVAPSRRRG